MADNNTTIVWDAAKAGNVQEFNDALDAHPELIDVAYTGQTPLCIAAEYGHTEIIETLVQRGSQALDTLTPHGTAPLHYAAQEGHEHIIELLIHLGSRMIDHASDYNGATPLRYASAGGHLSTVELLLQHGATSIDIADKSDLILLQHAVYRGHAHIAEYLLQRGHGSVDLTSKNGETLIWSAACSGHASIIELLMRLGCTTIDTPYNGTTPIFTALQYMHVDAAEALVRLGCNVDVYTNNNGTLFHAAARCDATPQLLTLLKKFNINDIDAQDSLRVTPLYEAVIDDNCSMITTFLLLGSNAINTPDDFGYTPLQSALAIVSAETTKLLVQHGASLDVKIDEAIVNTYHDEVDENSLKVLKLVGVDCSSLSTKRDSITTENVEYLLAPIVEEDAAKVRYEIYFQRSLSHRLLFLEKRQRNQRRFSFN